MPRLSRWLGPSFLSPAVFGHSGSAGWVTGGVIWLKAVSDLRKQDGEVGKLWWDLLLVQPRLRSACLQA